MLRVLPTRLFEQFQVSTVIDVPKRVGVKRSDGNARLMNHVKRQKGSEVARIWELTPCHSQVDGLSLQAHGCFGASALAFQESVYQRAHEGRKPQFRTCWCVAIDSQSGHRGAICGLADLHHLRGGELALRVSVFDCPATDFQLARGDLGT